MTLELDHYFILTNDVKKAGDSLLEFGLEEQTPRSHPGQGTANRRFVFKHGPLLELLYVRDVEEAKNGVAKDLCFYQRQTDNQASPFGLVFRQADSLLEKLPFPGWTYQPEYFEPPMAFHVGENAKILSEPLCICMPFPIDQDHNKLEETDNYVERIIINIPSKKLSDTIKIVEADNKSLAALEIKMGNEHLVEVVISNDKEESKKRSKDLRPLLPLIIWH